MSQPIMSQPSSHQHIASTKKRNDVEIRFAFALRLTWDTNTRNWQILLRSIHDEEAWIFVDMESAVLHLESWMAKQSQRFGEETLSQ